MHTSRLAASIAAALLVSAAPGAQTPHPPSFESSQVHPLDASPDGERLLVVNTPDGRLCEYSTVDPRRPRLLREIPLAAEPVSVRFRTADEAWVVSQLGDVVQVVDLAAGEVTATLQIGDAPADVVFAGGHAWVTLATTAEVVILDAGSHAEVARVVLPCEDPRWALASQDGTRVWVASHRSGNGTTLVPVAQAPSQPPPTNSALPPAPPVALIVEADDPQWASAHGISVADWDVFEFDVASLQVVRRIEAVGTTLFGMAEVPGADQLLVANTEARNTTRYEPALRGHVVDNRVSRIDLSDGSVTAHDLNAGVDYNRLPNPFARATSLAQPTDVLVSPDGNRTYVAAFGTDRIAILDGGGRVMTRIEVGPGGGSATQVDPRNKRGPRAMAHHPTAPVLYVLNRLSNSVSVIDTLQLLEVGELELFDPTPAVVREGRGFLYDARLSGNGTASCASCHIDGGFDGLAWDLGDPGGTMTTVVNAQGQTIPVHPMKGPMTTQSLRGLDVDGPLHWRGEKDGFADFNGTFDTLLGGSPLPAADVARFEAFVETLTRAPNPNRDLRDRPVVGADPQGGDAVRGEQIFHTRFGGMYQRSLSCADCHTQPDGTGIHVVDPFILQLPQAFRPAVLRDVYRRDARGRGVDGKQISGFGLSFDGRHDHAVAHLQSPAFLFFSPQQRADLQAFLRAFDTGTHPTVGHQLDIDATNRLDADVVARRNALVQAATQGDTDLVGRAVIDGVPVGLWWDPAARVLVQDRSGNPPLALHDLDLLVQAGRAQLLTLMGVPEGTGRRAVLDRDGDGQLDGDTRGVADYGAPSGSRPAAVRSNRAPRLGDGDFAVVVDRAPADGQAAVLVGFARTDMPVAGTGLRLLVDPLGLSGFTVSTDRRGTGILPMPLPADPQFDGVVLHLQTVTLERGAASASAGLTLTLND